MNGAVKRTPMPVIAGILNIVMGIFILIILSIFAIVPKILEPFQGGMSPYDFSSSYIIAPALIIALTAIIGGILAIKRKIWGWALAGSIAASISPIPLGIAAIILLVLSRKEFNRA